ncbi:MAG: hypothetical protein IJV27_07605 [Prevotella sp.]|nr:hypothetical protein [Prevotella sp.]
MKTVFQREVYGFPRRSLWFFEERFMVFRKAAHGVPRKKLRFSEKKFAIRASFRTNVIVE